MYENDNVFTINSNYKFYVYNFNYSIIIMKLWITRDCMGLWLYTTKPLFNSSKKEFESVDDNTLYINDDKLFPEVTFENSPQQVELKLVKEE